MYLARVDTAKTSSTLAIRGLVWDLQNCGWLDTCHETTTRAASTLGITAATCISWYVTIATVRSFITVDIETMPIQRGGNLV